MKLVLAMPPLLSLMVLLAACADSRQRPVDTAVNPTSGFKVIAAAPDPYTTPDPLLDTQTTDLLNFLTAHHLDHGAAGTGAMAVSVPPEQFARARDLIAAERAKHPGRWSRIRFTY